MTEKSFIKDLMAALKDQVPERVMAENAQVYHEYFATKREEGASDEEIFREIGDVDEIAKTIIEMSKEETYFHSSREAGLLDGETPKQAREQYRMRKRKSLWRAFLDKMKL